MAVLKCKRIDPVQHNFNVISLQVLSINEIDVSTRNPQIFIDEKTKVLFYKYQNDTHFSMYSSHFNYQKITLNGLLCSFHPSNIAILEKEEQKIIPEVGKSYVLKNGCIVKIVAFENDKQFVDQPQFIGVCLQSSQKTGAIRFSEKGELLSHAGSSDFEIKREYTPQTYIWLWLEDSSKGFRTLTFRNKDNALDYQQRYGGKLKEVVFNGDE